MNRYTHDCPDCSCLNPAGPTQWMADRLIHTPDPAGLGLTTGDLYASYMKWESNNPDVGPEFTQTKLTRWLRTQGMVFIRANNANTAYGWSFKP